MFKVAYIYSLFLFVSFQAFGQELQLSADSISFDRVLLEDERVFKVTYENVTENTLVISDLFVWDDVNFWVHENCVGELFPGESCQAEILFSPTYEYRFSTFVVLELGNGHEYELRITGEGYL